uniref:Uncharacterized protein n=1 Tax=Anguilla anguilla TaxID=7936 RepID=A0A0E9S4V7_ANGAN
MVCWRHRYWFRLCHFCDGWFYSGLNVSGKSSVCVAGTNRKCNCPIMT